MNSTSQDRLVADNIGYKVSLLRVAPGKEAAVARQLNRSIVKDGLGRPVAMLKLFGRFDVCAIYRTKDYLDGPSKFGPIHGIRGSNKINAFHWLSPNESSGLSVERAKGDIWALSFFRFNESVIKRVGVEIELLLARDWRNYIPAGVTLDVLGTTGWGELLLILRGGKFEQVAEALSSISKQLVGLRERDITFLPAKTLSFLGINFALTLPRNRRVLKSRLTESFRPGTGVFPRLLVTCPPAGMKAVENYGRIHFGRRGAESFGATDFAFQPTRSSWGNFIAKVLDLRRDLLGKIYSTSVNILCAPTTRIDFPYKTPTRDVLHMPPADDHCFTRWPSTLEHRLRNLYFGLSNLLQDPLVGDCFEDLRLIAEEKLPEALRTFDPKDEDRKLIYEVVELLAYATEQRAHGAFLSLEHLESSLSPTKGGIQRILVAVELIARKLLARVKKRWHGFVVAGYHNEFFSSHYEILNLPFEYLFEPEQWCGLFHEIGHAAFFDRRFYDMDGEEMTNLIRRAVPGASEDDWAFTQWKELAWEIGADMFDLYFCYGKDLDSYLRNIWPFISDGSHQLSAERFRRYFLVFEFWKHLLIREQSSFGRFVDIDADMRLFRRRLKILDPKLRTDPSAYEEARVAFAGMASVAEVFYEKFRQIAGPRDLKAELEKPAMRDAIKSVLRGTPWLEPIEEPDTFILGLKNARNLNRSAKLAAIASLWHSAKKESVSI